MDLATISIVVTIGAGVVVILGGIFGWLGKLGSFVTWFVDKVRRRPANDGNIVVPRSTLVLVPSYSRQGTWWHMGRTGGDEKRPAMQVVGHLTATNISSYNVLVTGAKLRKPAMTGHAMVRDPASNMYDSRHMIEKDCVQDVSYDFWIDPPVRKLGETFIGDIAIIDQFGNEHWVRNVEFRYE